MKATGIVRRIDDLGRVVIPKEIRRTLKIREGDPLEIFTDREGEVILKKYSPIGELGTLSGKYAESIAETIKCTVCITDHDQIIAAAGSGKKELLNKYISREMEEALEKREQLLAASSSSRYIPVADGQEQFAEEIIYPVISEGDVIGSVVLFHKEEKRKFGEPEKLVAKSASEFLGRQMES